MSVMKDILLRNPEQLGRAIRLRRHEKRLSQVALARLLGVERKWVLHLEAGNPKAELGLVLNALTALGLSAHVHDQNHPRSAQSRSKSPSRLDEVFQQLQRPERK